jgi:hypothetical protein
LQEGPVGGNDRQVLLAVLGHAGPAARHAGSDPRREKGGNRRPFRSSPLKSLLPEEAPNEGFIDHGHAQD